ncbi:sulfide:quinone oxidoreductase [Deinococcus metalli]|uniref:Pyridine nucleotide-disulfide oxidoreductase n=1 Tax=Deinococcus metalli TaxID=1141878 RepID=A0A7W8NRH3_9DEIO|nr:FAD/NAD(P)-binding oxidoreductase [Deinococcus metalli]MBB5378981.1 sulfide:quinone oxidoreductase [Deinococcus metalli]GHF63605.1 pyridine nucleotide-disulfide oxidoreductase [Deinococcus metalli]
MRHQILIIGGGSAGISVAARLRRRDPSLSVAVIEPSEVHYYQPYWTLVGAGIVPKEASVRLESSVMPRGVTWIRDRVERIEPDANAVVLSSGQRVEYEQLVVAPGLRIDWEKVKGLKETLGKNGVCSIYDYQQAEKTWEMIRTFQGGHAIFTAPATPIKCGGAPQKIMFLAEETFVQQGIKHNSQVSFYTGGGVIFGVKVYADALQKVADRKDLDYKFKHDLHEIRPESREAVFCKTTDAGLEEVVVKYDLLHVVPPMSAPAFVQESPLALQEGPLKGWMAVDHTTLQSTTHPNVFGLGDVIGTPNAKTGAAIRKQAPTVVTNLLAARQHLTMTGAYDGYGSCPLVTGRGKLILAEFNYKNEATPSFPFDQAKERYDMYLLKRHGLPFLYWNLMLKGLA